ncbi:MAG: protein kinase domain-containing protein [Planctomycetota bacterium]
MTDERRIEAILQEWHERYSQGEEIDVEEVVRAHPDIADDIRRRLAALQIVDQVLPSAADTPETAPMRIGDFRILRQIGRGGMGVVYEAEQTSMKRRVALKVLSPAITGTGQAVKRFQREAQAAGRLHHTNIVPIHGMGQSAGHWYYAMELVEGCPLSSVIAEQRVRSGQPTEEGLALQAMPTASSGGRLEAGTGTGARAYFIRVAEVFAGVADALHLAHEEGIVHRDIKPSNLLLDADGVLKIVDFGLAYTSDDGPPMTLTGDLLGTPVYMSPEQAMPKRIKLDHRTDLYSLGATLYELLTLRPPFEGESLPKLCSQILNREPPLPRRCNPRIPRDLETIVLKAMEKDRDKRYQSGGELARDLRRFADGGAIRARRIGLTGRAWRKVKRHKVRSALTAALLLVGIAAAIETGRAMHEQEQRKRLEYDRLLARGEGVMALSHAQLKDATWHADPDPEQTARDLFSRAALLMPDRPEAYFLRVLVPGATLDERLRDLAAAHEHGLTKRTFDLARASVSSLNAVKPRTVGAIPELADASPIEAFFAARLAAAVGDDKAADRFLARAVEDSPSASSVRYLALSFRALQRKQRGDWSGVLEDLLAVQTIGDDSLEVRAGIAIAWFRSGVKEVGEQHFADLLAEARVANSALAWRFLIQRCRHVDPWYDQAALEAHEAHPDDPMLLAVMAEVHGRAGEYEKAIAVCDELLAGDPGDRAAHRAHETKGWALLQRGQPNDALAAFELSAQRSDTCFTLHTKCAHALFALRKHDEALAAADRACKLNLHHPDAHAIRGVILEVGRSESIAALAAFERVLELRQTAQDWLNLATSQMSLKKHEEALSSLTRATECDNGSLGGHMLRGFVLSDNLRRYDEAVAAFTRVLEIQPNQHWGLYCRAVTQLRLSRLDKALEDIESARTLAPWDVNIWGMQAEILSALQRHPEALKSAERALALGDGEGQLLRAMILADLGRFEHAELALAKWEPLAAGPQIAVFRSWVFDRCGKPDLALAAAKTALTEAQDEEIRVESAVVAVRSLRALRRTDDARELAAAQAKGEPHRADRLDAAYLCAVAGDTARATRLVEAWDFPWTARAAYQRACVHAVLGDKPIALEWFARAAAAGLRRPLDLVPDPDMAPFSEDP